MFRAQPFEMAAILVKECALFCSQVVGGNGTPNTDKKVRLQLFQPPRTSVRSGNMVEVSENKISVTV